MWPLVHYKYLSILEITILNEVSQMEMSYDRIFMRNLKRNDTNELIYKAETDSQI